MFMPIESVGAQEEPKDYFRFAFRGDDGVSIDYEFTTESSVHYAEVKSQFERFLAGVYGYDVTDVRMEPR